MLQNSTVKYGNYEPLNIDNHCKEFEDLYKTMKKIWTKIEKLDALDPWVNRHNIAVVRYPSDKEISKNRKEREKLKNILHIYEIRTAVKIYDILWIPNDDEILEKSKISFKIFETGPDYNRRDGYEVKFDDLPIFYVKHIAQCSRNARKSATKYLEIIK